MLMLHRCTLYRDIKATFLWLHYGADRRGLQGEEMLGRIQFNEVLEK
jgi:hypothetical protein